MKIFQYTCGRGDSDGYNSSAESKGAALLVEEWMQGKTRASIVENELPVMEVQFCGDTQEKQPKIVLCCSRHVLNEYAMHDGKVVVESKTRPYNYSHYLILSSDEGEKDPEKRVLQSLELLLKKELFLTPYSFQQAVREGHASFDNLQVDEKELGDAWNECRETIVKKPMLTGLEMAAFLARYWETCWKRKNDAENTTPLLLITTSPNQAAITNNTTIIQDGVYFFHECVVPYLPTAVLEMFSLSAGCLGEAIRAQKGTACMVCYPTEKTINMNPVYRVYNDTIVDNQLNSIYLKIGKMLLDHLLPKSYEIICQLKQYKKAEQDFGIIYTIVELEALLEGFNTQTQTDLLLQLALESGKRILALEKMLKNDGLNDTDAYSVLLPLRTLLAEQCSKKIRVFDSTLYRQWIDLVNRIPAELESESKKDDESKWNALLTRQYPALQWDRELPFILTAEYALNTQKPDLFLECLKNGQIFDHLIGIDDQDALLHALQLQQKLHFAGLNNEAHKLLAFLARQCEPNENLLSPISYIQIVSDKGDHPDCKEFFYQDMEILVQRHHSFLIQQGIRDMQDAWKELKIQQQQYQFITSTLGFALDKATLLMAEGEEYLLAWSVQNQHMFDREYYSHMLVRAVTLPQRVGQLSSETIENLRTLYDKYLLKHFEGCKKDNNPLITMMGMDWKTVTSWELQAVIKTAEEEYVPCDSVRLLSRLILLHEHGEHMCAEAYLNLTLSDPELINSYLQETMEKGIGEDWPSSEVSKLIRQPSAQEQLDIQLLGKWYVAHKSTLNRELTCLVEQVFDDKLRQAQENLQGIEQITALYYTSVFENQGNSPFIEQVYAPFHGKNLEKNTEKTEAFAGVKYLCAQSEEQQKRGVDLLRESIAQSSADGIKAEDVKHAIDFASYAGLHSCQKEILKLTADVAGNPLPNDVLSTLKDYAASNSESRDQLMAIMTDRVCGSNHQECARFMEEFLWLINSITMEWGKKQEFLSKAIRNILEHPEGYSLFDSALQNMLYIAKDASSQPFKLLFMNMMERVNLSNEASQMQQTALALGITYSDLQKDKMPRWNEYFFQDSTNRIAQDLTKNPPSLEHLYEMAKGDNKDVLVVNDLHNSVGNRIQDESRQKICQAVRNAIQKDAALSDKSGFSQLMQNVFAMRNEKTKFFTDCIFMEARFHIAQLLISDDYFSRLLDDEKSVRDLNDFFEIMNQERLPQLENKKKLLVTACRVMDDEDRIADNRFDCKSSLHQLMQISNIPGWQWVSEIVYHHGKEKMKNCRFELQLIPHLINSIRISSEKNDIDWYSFLNSAIPLQNETGWEQTDIWNSGKSNVSGKLAYIIEWLTMNEMEEELGSFYRFLNTSSIGEKARNRKKNKEIERHISPKSEKEHNAFLDWLLTGGTNAKS